MPIYKICHQAEWAQTLARPFYAGSPKDKADGFIHFSTAEQLLATLERHYAGADDLVLLAVDPAPLGEALRAEPSTGGALYPHLYGPLPLSAVLWTAPIMRDANGGFVLPAECV